jgi:hypothetical protein
MPPSQEDGCVFTTSSSLPTSAAQQLSPSSSFLQDPSSFVQVQAIPLVDLQPQDQATSVSSAHLRPCRDPPSNPRPSKAR